MKKIERLWNQLRGKNNPHVSTETGRVEDEEEVAVNLTRWSTIYDAIAQQRGFDKTLPSYEAMYRALDSIFYRQNTVYAFYFHDLQSGQGFRRAMQKPHAEYELRRWVEDIVAICQEEESEYPNIWDFYEDLKVFCHFILRRPHLTDQERNNWKVFLAELETFDPRHEKIVRLTQHVSMEDVRARYRDIFGDTNNPLLR